MAATPPTAVAAASPLMQLLRKSYPAQFPSESSEEVSHSALIHSTYPRITYSDNEKAEITQWLITSAHIADATQDTAKSIERLSSLNTHLSTRTTLLGSKSSVADVAIYSRLAPVISGWSSDERTGEKGYHHVVRHIDFVQNSPLFNLKVEEEEKVKIDPDDVVVNIKPLDPKAEKERRKKEKDAAAAAAGGDGAQNTLPVGGQGKKDKENASGAADASSGQKSEKKQKQKKQPVPAPAEKPLSPSLIDLRVGHILKATTHPNADSLYVSTISVGDPAGTESTSEYEHDGRTYTVRTVCSGLNGLVPLEEMQNRKIVAVCNLKPVSMRGVKSCAMVLAASPRPQPGDADESHTTPVELVNPPSYAQTGERVWFEGWGGQDVEPEKQLNPKKKVWENCQPGFTTTTNKEVAFDPGAVEQLKGSGAAVGVGTLKTKGGVCTVSTLKDATVR
ncbi:MAG: G4 quadruplex nucleic acid binding protein [Alyxoria varia]|nr:MAG: G4 quadruplex nucleic acid binding protein [Alyxoria varia]